MSTKFWEYFLNIEADLARCARYVDFDEANFPTFSNEFARIIVVASAEIDAILNELCGLISPKDDAGNIQQYYPVIMSRYVDFSSCQLDVRRFQLLIAPWKNWTSEASPAWWGKGYNKIKHDRTYHFKSANLENAIHAVGALFLCILHYHDHVTGGMTVDINRGTQLFTPAKPKGDLSRAAWFYKIPTSV
jgi:hypothetical protein